jgi:hypothetical protein
VQIFLSIEILFLFLDLELLGINHDSFYMKNQDFNNKKIFFYQNKKEKND